MRRNLPLRIGIVVAVILVSAFFLYPPKKTINLGLDLQGGIHLVLGVDVDKALAALGRPEGDTMRAELEKKGIGVEPRRAPGQYRARGAARLAPDLERRADRVRRRRRLRDKESDQAAGRVVLALRARESGRAARRRGPAGPRDDPQPRGSVRRGRAVHPAAGRQSHPHPASRRPGPRAGQGPHRQDRAARVQAGGRARGPEAVAEGTVPEGHRGALPAPRGQGDRGRSARSRTWSRSRRSSPAATCPRRGCRSTRTPASHTCRWSSTRPARRPSPS